MDQLEIRWHGRGGQGAKTASLLLAEILASAGYYVQAFPEYGPERMGAPLTAFTRVSRQPIAIRGAIQEPDVVAILDPTLLRKERVMDGLRSGGMVVINTPADPEGIKGAPAGSRIITIDASRIARETIGRDIPNTPLIGTLIANTELIELEEFFSLLKPYLEKKFRHHPELLPPNLEAVRRGGKEYKAAVSGISERVAGVVRKER